MWFREKYALHERGIEIDVRDHNCYRLPDRFEDEDVMIDVGAHVGIFAMACFERRCRKVISYEAHPANFEALLYTTGKAGYGHPIFEGYHRAVWRSDLPDGLPLSLAGFDENNPQANTGGSTVAELAQEDHNSRLVKSIGLDTILKGVLGGRIFLKLDCEGSEYPILGTSRMLHRVHFMAVELHDKPLRRDAWAIAPEVLPIILENQGFKVEYGTDRYSNILYATRS